MKRRTRFYLFQGMVGIVSAFLQWLLFLAMIAGGVWLALPWIVALLQVPLELPKVEVQGWPLQTLLLVGGAAAGIVLSLVSRLFVEVGARSKAAKARRILTDAIAAVTASEVVAPVHKELDRLASARDAVRQAL